MLVVCHIYKKAGRPQSPAKSGPTGAPPRPAARLVVESVAETAMGRSTKLNLEEVCARLEINVADVRARAQQLRDASCRRTQ